MTTWNDYKAYVKDIDNNAGTILTEVETKSAIVTAIIDQRGELGLSQRDLAAICDVPQSTIARIESSKTSPSIDMLLKILHALGLTITVSKTKTSNV